MSQADLKARQAKAAARKRQAVASTGVAAGLVTLVSIYVPTYLSLFVEQREILLIFTALLSVLLIALHEAAKRMALWGDAFVDRFEAFHLDLLQVFKMLAIFACVSYGGQIFLEYFLAGPIFVPNLLFCIVVLLGLALALLPLFKDVVLHWGEEETDEAEEGEDSEDGPKGLFPAAKDTARLPPRPLQQRAAVTPLLRHE
jgi:hypothetical protein